MKTIRSFLLFGFVLAMGTTCTVQAQLADSPSLCTFLGSVLSSFPNDCQGMYDPASADTGDDEKIYYRANSLPDGFSSGWIVLSAASKVISVSYSINKSYEDKDLESLYQDIENCFERQGFNFADSFSYTDPYMGSDEYTYTYQNDTYEAEMNISESEDIYVTVTYRIRS